MSSRREERAPWKRLPTSCLTGRTRAAVNGDTPREPASAVEKAASWAKNIENAYRHAIADGVPPARIRKVLDTHVESAEDYDVPRDQAQEEADRLLRQTPKSPLRSFTLAQLRARPRKVRELIVAPFMGRAESTFFYGPKGHGKTWAAESAAIVGAQGNGARFLNFHAAGPGVPTLYVDAEMFEHDLRQRADDICRTAGLDPGDNLFFWTPDAQPDGTPTLNLLEESGRRMLDDHIADIGSQTGKPIEQIYFDNLSTLLHGWVEKDSDSWDPILRWTLELRARQIGNAWVHHSNRSGGYRGSSAIVTTMHSIIKIAHPDGYRADMGANFDLTYEYTRAKPESGLYDINARLEGDVWSVKESKPDHDELIRLLFLQGLTLRAIADQIGVSKSAVERTVKRLGLERAP
jgi:hypothetical protein